MDTTLPLLAASLAMLAATCTVTRPYAVGTISAVYVVPLPEKFVAVPFVTVISATTKPVTDSLKVMMTGIGELIVTLGSVVEIVTVGDTVS